jgi:hypothetical protein
LAEAFRRTLRQVVAASPHRNVHLMEGADILTDIGGLTGDLVHPADHGMVTMGETLACRIRTILERAPRA